MPKTQPAAKPNSRKNAPVRTAACILAVLCLTASLIGVLGNILQKPVTEAQFREDYYANNDRIAEMTLDHGFDINPNYDAGNSTGVHLRISAPTENMVPAGGEVAVVLEYSGPVANLWLGEGNIVLDGFCATISLKQISNTEIKILLTNVQAAEVGKDAPKSISITGGTAIGSDQTLADSVTSTTFIITPSFPTILLETLFDLKVWLMLAAVALLGVTYILRSK